MYLLDTHTLLWFAADSGELSKNARQILENEKNDIYLSAASVWEITIKSSLEKIKLKNEPNKFISDVIEEYSLIPLAITIPHTLEIYKLPDIHKDPFDRILIAQARVENLTIITADKYIQQYKIKTLW